MSDLFQQVQQLQSKINTLESLVRSPSAVAGPVQDPIVEIVRLNPSQNVLKYRNASAIIIVLCDTAKQAFAVALPYVKSAKPRVFYFKRLGAVNALTLQPKAGETIDGQDCYILNGGRTSWPIQANSEWSVL